MDAWLGSLRRPSCAHHGGRIVAISKVAMVASRIASSGWLGAVAVLKVVHLTSGGSSLLRDDGVLCARCDRGQTYGPTDDDGAAAFHGRADALVICTLFGHVTGSTRP